MFCFFPPPPPALAKWFPSWDWRPRLSAGIAIAILKFDSPASAVDRGRELMLRRSIT